MGTADGLFAWYGTTFEDANQLLGDLSQRSSDATPKALRQALSLMIAHRRPSHFLVQPAGRVELTRLTDVYLNLLASADVIPPQLARRALETPIELLTRAPDRPRPAFIRQKAANQIRTHLLPLTSVSQMYDLDKIDLTATATLDVGWQVTVASLLARVRSPEAVSTLGLDSDNMLRRGDPSKVIYSFTLLETTPLGNVVRIQTDTVDGPLSFVEASRVELGSTAKLRTLPTSKRSPKSMDDCPCWRLTPSAPRLSPGRTS